MIEFTRASKATYIDKNGVLREAQINEPRFEKDGLLVEGSSTNLCSLSDRFLVQIAGQAELNVLSDSIGKYTEISVLTTNWTVQQLISVKPNKTYTASFWVKFKAGLTLQCGLDFNSNSGATPKLMRVLGTGDWVRVSATGISGSTTNTAYPKIMFFDDAVGEKVYIRFCQLEEMPFATSYIPTNGAPVTRAADSVYLRPVDYLTKDGGYSVACHVQGNIAPLKAFVWFDDSSKKIMHFYKTGAGHLETRNFGYQSTHTGTNIVSEHTISFTGMPDKSFASFDNVLSPVDGKGYDDVSSPAISGWIIGCGSYHITDFRVWSNPLTKDQIVEA